MTTTKNSKPYHKCNICQNECPFNIKLKHTQCKTPNKSCSTTCLTKHFTALFVFYPVLFQTKSISSEFYREKSAKWAHFIWNSPALSKH